MRLECNTALSDSNGNVENEDPIFHCPGFYSYFIGVYRVKKEFVEYMWSRATLFSFFLQIRSIYT